MRTAKPKYPNLPYHIWKQSNGRYRNTLNGKWLSDADLQQYAAKPQQKEQEIKLSPSHEDIYSKRWDLHY